MRTHFITDGSVLPAVDGVSLRVERGQIVALVGESGCGKSVTALSIMRLLPKPPAGIVGGEVLFRESPDRGPVDLLQLAEADLQRLRGNRLAMIFQDPLSSLNPVYTVGEQIVEVIEQHLDDRAPWCNTLAANDSRRLKTAARVFRRFAHGDSGWRRKRVKELAVEALREVGIPAPERRVDDYPHRLSGGMQQRVMIAMALICRPALLIADEPTTALDVTVQQQILELLSTLRDRHAMSVILITHDLGVVAEIADYVYVMYAGRIVEHAAVTNLFAEPLHPYTQGLLQCVPRFAGDGNPRSVIPGSVPDLARLPSGCRFHPRCRLSAAHAADPDADACRVDADVGTHVLRRCVAQYPGAPSGQPDLREMRPSHFVACWEVRATS